MLPFYDPNLTYQENYDLGPFGPFAQDLSPEDRAALDLPKAQWTGLSGLTLRRPVGIPSGPLLNSRFVAAAFRWGYDLSHYKTVRSRDWPSHPAPNVLRVAAARPIAPDEMGKERLAARPFAPGELLHLPSLSITNSFGMPAQPPHVWQADMEMAARSAGPGQAMVASVTGTALEGSTHADYVADHARTAAMCVEAGAHAIEVNLSCPNVGGHGLICQHPQSAAEVCEAVREAIPSHLPLFAKIGNFVNDESSEATLRALVAATVPFVQGYGAVNAVPVPVVSSEGAQALPGAGRSVAGVCGAALRAVGLDTVQRLAALRNAEGYDYSIVGVGGFLTPDDYFDYRQAGADVVQGATGPMWDHLLALKVARAEAARILAPTS